MIVIGQENKEIEKRKSSKILKILYVVKTLAKNSDKWYSVRDIARNVNININVARKYLDKMVDMKITLIETRKGNGRNSRPMKFFKWGLNGI